MSQPGNTRHGFSTRAVHDGQPPDPLTGAVNVPLYLSSTYAQEELGKDKGYDYSRAGNPTRTAVENSLASLEGGTTAHVFGSGMAAIMALVALFKSGDHVICGENVYGGVPRLFNQIVANYGITFTYLDTSDPENVRRALQPNTRLVHIETPTNPLMTLTDIRAVADVCHANGVELSVDNTFLSPYFQRPIELGADIVMHSTTKFLNGHSDGIGGVLVVTKPEHKEKFDFVEKAMGGILSPFESWLILRGVKTLAVRMRQHDASGRAIAAHLEAHPKVAQGVLSRARQPPATRISEAPTNRLRLADDCGAWVEGKCQRFFEAAAGKHAGRVSRRSRDAGLASRDHDACSHRPRGPRKNRHYRGHGAALDRH